MFHRIVAVLALFGVCVGAAIWLVGGLTIPLPGITIRAGDPFRPLGAAAVLTAMYFITGGRVDLRRWAAPLVVALAVLIAATGISRNSWTAGGSDSYAYVSQADLWLSGSLHVEVPLALDAPWPDAPWTFSPHGFKPAVGAAAIVPVTSPGLPLLMAGAKALAGHCAMFLVPPLCAALLVWITFAIGRLVRSDLAGLVAAWLIATSPTVLAMIVSPMSDVPAAAGWAAAMWLALQRSAAGAIGAGIAAGAAILIRANLAPLAVVIALWLWWADRKFSRMALMAAATIPGIAIVAAVNTSLYGSPLSSGYGALSDIFSVAHVPTNVWRYGTWLVESQTLAAPAGLLALATPAAIFWRSRRERESAILMAAVTATVWALYLVYTPYDAWWFLRFLLPSWPAMCMGMAVILTFALEHSRRAVRAAAFVFAVFLGVYGVRYGLANGALPTGEGDHRYASLAKTVEANTSPSDVVITGQHGGPIRYYAGRTIVRFDLIQPGALDSALDWLQARGRRPIVLLEDWEMAPFRERFSGKSRIGHLPLTPIVEYRSPTVAGTAYLFDPARPLAETSRASTPASAASRCVHPAVLLH